MLTAKGRFTMQATPKELKGFGEAAHSLKLYRRADLRDDVTDKELIGKLYVDPLQNDAVLDTMLRESTTFLIGRKGTGKSTIFQRAQHELRSRPNAVSAYVDIKTVYEAADIDPAVPNQLAQAGIALSEEGLKKVLVYRSFIRAVFLDVKKELKDQLNSSAIKKILDKIGIKKSDLSASIDELLEGSFDAQITNITTLKAVAKKVQTESGSINTETGSATVASDLSNKGINLNAKFGDETKTEKTSKSVKIDDFSEILLRTFNINKVIEDLGHLLNGIGISKLYIFVDDFSELPEDAMRVFVDAVLAPLNNWSNELIKFKVAAYPGRIYLGRIDPTKIDEVYLDLYKLYGDKDVSTMEDKGADFIRRLIDSRFKQFVGKDFSEFCDSDINGVYRELFYATMANPRILGHLLTNIRDSSVAYGGSIGRRAIQDASSKYYEEKIEPFFGVHKFALESFSERASTFSLKELLESLVQRSVDLREYKSSKVTASISGRTPSSHFHVSKVLESALRTLELNFFMTLYYEMKDRDGNKVSIYALNHGLCGKYKIAFGRPSGHVEYRLYFVERVFDSTSIVRKFLESNQEIKCNACGTAYGLDKLDGLMMFDMLCPSCKNGTCEVSNLSRKYENVLARVDPGLLLPATELGILDALYTEGRKMVASEIAGELDCSYQLIGKRGRNLSERGLVSRDKNEVNRRTFSLTDDARRDYFEGNNERTLDVDEPI
jgi:DNA-binding MarR family transcriptional regulator